MQHMQYAVAAIIFSTASAMARTVTPGSGPVLVTGASGLVGANVANALRQEGYTVRAAVRDPAAEKNEFLRAMGCELVRVPDLRSRAGPTRWLGVWAWPTWRHL